MNYRSICVVWDKRLFVALATVFTAVLVLYYPYLSGLIEDWGANDDYSHGYFIPFIAMYMVYAIRRKIIVQPVKPQNLGLVIIVAGLAVLIVSKIGSEFFLQRTSFIIVLIGCVSFLLGSHCLKLLSVPICYLIFMIPLPAIIWNKIAFPLQLFGSYLTEQIVRFLGIPIFREGNVLHLVETTLEVVAACSGLRSLMTMFALATLLAFLSSLSYPRKIILFISAAPVAIAANIFRLTSTAILATKYGSEVAHGFMHDFSGMVVFAVGFSLLLGISTILNSY